MTQNYKSIYEETGWVASLILFLSLAFAIICCFSNSIVSTNHPSRVRILQSTSDTRGNRSDSRNSDQRTAAESQSSSSDVPVGVWVGVGCGILGFFGLLICLLAKRQQQVANAPNPQPPVVLTEQIPIEESSGKSAQDETDPNPVQAYPALSLEAMLSFDEEALQNIGQNFVGMPVATRYYTNPVSVRSRAQAGEPGVTDHGQLTITLGPPTPQSTNTQTAPSDTHSQTRLRKSRIKRSQNKVPTLVTLNLQASSPAEQPVSRKTTSELTVQALGSTFRSEQDVYISSVEDSECREGQPTKPTEVEENKNISSKTTTACSPQGATEDAPLQHRFAYKPYKIPALLQGSVDPESTLTESIPSDKLLCQLVSQKHLPIPKLLQRLQETQMAA